jgi:hypothetical protein
MEMWTLKAQGRNTATSRCIRVISENEEGGLDRESCL